MLYLMSTVVLGDVKWFEAIWSCLCSKRFSFLFLFYFRKSVSSSWHHDFWHLPGFLLLRTKPHPSLSFCVHTDAFLLLKKKKKSVLLSSIHACAHTYKYTRNSQLNRKWRQWWNLSVMFRAQGSNRTDKRQSPAQNRL